MFFVLFLSVLIYSTILQSPWVGNIHLLEMGKGMQSLDTCFEELNSFIYTIKYFMSVFFACGGWLKMKQNVPKVTLSM